MKTNKIPVIVCAVLTVLLAIAAVLCFVLPAPKPDGPVQVTETIKLGHYEDGNYNDYELNGKIKNVSDSSIVLYTEKSIVLFFNDDGSKVDTVTFANKATSITLAPGEEYDLSTSDNLYEVTGRVSSIVKVNVIVDGHTYTVSSGSSINSILCFVFIVLAVLFLTITIVSAKGLKKQAARAKSVGALVAQLGGGTVVRGFIGDRNEGKKAAAKTAGWAVGGALSAIFLGTGVFKVYSAEGGTELLVTDKYLYNIANGGADVNASNLQLITKEAFPVESIDVKNNTVVVSCADKIRCIKLFIDKKSTVTAEEMAAKLNDILVNAPAAEARAEAASAAEDPFASDDSVTASTVEEEK